MLTGGFRTPSVMNNAIASGKVDVVGLGRPFAIYPNVANEIFEGTRDNFDTDIKKTGVRAIDGMMNIIWYEFQIKKIGQGKAPNPNLSAWTVLAKYLALIAERRLTS